VWTFGDGKNRRRDAVYESGDTAEQNRFLPHAGRPTYAATCYFGDIMSHRIITVVVIAAVFASSLAVGQDVTRENPDTAYGKLMLTGHPAGSMIDVILTQNDRRITGKLIGTSENSFEIETAKSHKVSRQKIAFSDVKLVIKHGMSKKKKAALAVAAVAGGVAAVLAALAATFSGGMR
jgi:hypothetical protein